MRLQRMLDDAHRGEFSVLVVWAVDRLCRQGIEELLRLIRELRERKVSLVSHQEPWLNGTDATTELLAAVAAWVATQESVRRSERIRAGLARRKAQGKPMGGAASKRGKDISPRRTEGYKQAWARRKGSPIARRILRVKRGRHRPGGCRPISVLVDATAERGHATRLAALFVPLFVTARIDPGQCCPPGRA